MMNRRGIAPKRSASDSWALDAHILLKSATGAGSPIPLAIRVVADVSFQLPGHTSDRVKIGDTDTVSQLSLTYSSRDDSSRVALSGMLLIGIRVSLIVLHCPNSVYIRHPCTGTWSQAFRDSIYSVVVD